MNAINSHIRYLVLICLLLAGSGSRAQLNGDFYDYRTFINTDFQFSGFSTSNSQLYGTTIGKKMTEFTGLQLSPDQDGLLVVFKFTSFSLTPGRVLKLFNFRYNDQKIISGDLKDSTIILTRYFGKGNDQQFFTYTLYDKLFGLNSQPGSAATGMYEVYLYLSANFLWFEVHNLSNYSTTPVKFAHSPVHWGINAGPRTGTDVPDYAFSNVMDKFLTKQPQCLIEISNPYITSGLSPEAIPYLKIAGFKLDDLMADLQTYTGNSYNNNPNSGSSKGIVIRKSAESTSNDIIISDDPPVTTATALKWFSIAPNPVTGNTFILRSGLKKTTDVKCTITNVEGLQVYQSTYTAPAGVKNKQIYLPPALKNGLYYVEITAGDKVEIIKIVVAN